MLLSRSVLVFLLGALFTLSYTAAFGEDDTKKAAAKPAKDKVAKDEVSDRNCLKETGSRLAPRPDSKGRKCVNATGRSYTKGDMDSTGAIDLSDALRRLDPAVH